MDLVHINIKPADEKTERIPVTVTEPTGDDEAPKLQNRRQTCSQDDLDTALTSACHCGYAFLVYELVHLGANAQTRDRNGNTPFIICAENSFTDIASFFIERKVEINAANYCGNTALILASGRSGSVEMVKLLLAERGINVNYQNKEGYTALMEAIEAKDFHIIKLLLDTLINAKEILFKIRNCRHETAQDIANKLGIGRVVNLLSQSEREPIIATVLACDVNSFNILIDCHFYDSSKKCIIINLALKEMFKKHQQFFQAFNASEQQIIQRLLERGARVYDCNYGMDPIFIATRAGSFRVLQLLLERVAAPDLYAHSRHKDSLRVAAESGRIDLIQLLINHSEAYKLKYSHIEWALKHGHADCARFILWQGVFLDLKTALESAVANQLPVHVKFLVENFYVALKQFAHTQEMNNILVSASKYGNVEIIALLLDAGANVNCVSTDKKTPLMESKNAEVVYYLVQRGAIVRQPSTSLLDYYSPLIYILSRDHGYHEFSTREAIIEALLKCGADADVRNYVGKTPLMIAVSNSERKNIIQMLLSCGAQCNLRDSQGNTPLLLAAIANNTANILCLIPFSRFNKDILNAQNYIDQFTALIMASKNNNSVAVRYLVGSGADVNVADASGNSALCHAVISKDDNSDILKMLISAGSNVNHQNNAGFSPLMLAAKDCKQYIIELLIQNYADVNSVSKTIRDQTALSVLSYKSHLDQKTLSCMNYLLVVGARASYVSPDVLHKLIIQGNIELIPKLIHRGLGPSLISVFTTGTIHVMSPLCVAIIAKNFQLVHYFVENLFLTRSDIYKLLYSQDARQHLMSTPLRSLLSRVTAQPMSLFNLAFVEVQSAVGSAPGREQRISMLPLPRLIKNRLMFNNEDVKFHV